MSETPPVKCKNNIVATLCAAVSGVVFYVLAVASLSALQQFARDQGSIEVSIIAGSMIKPLLLMAAAVYFWVKGYMIGSVNWPVFKVVVILYLVASLIPYVLSFEV